MEPQDHHHNRHHRPNHLDHQEQHPNYFQHQHPHLHHHQFFNRNDPPFAGPGQSQDHQFTTHSLDNHFSYETNHQMGGQPNEPFGEGGIGGFCSNGRKRGRFHSGRVTDHTDDAVNIKLYVAPVPGSTSEGDIRPLFEGHGSVVEIIFPRDKWTGQQQGYCFVKYATIEEADRAISALNGQYTVPGETVPIKVRYADRERERLAKIERERSGNGPREQHLGGGEFVEKLYVGSINKQASKQEIEEIFSPYGHVEDVYIARDMLKQSRGCAFIKFSHRDMAVAAMKALNGTFTMRGCNQPLTVRFADPKKRRTGELRGNYAPGAQNCGPCSQEPMNRPPPNFGVGGYILPNASCPMQEISTNSQPQAVSHKANLALGGPHVIEQPLPPVNQPLTQLCQMPLQHTPQKRLQLSQPAISQMMNQTQSSEQQQNVEIPLESAGTESNPQATSVASVPSAMPPSPVASDNEECDWSEHTCPDGYKYYYNCTTCESRWEKPDEFTLFQQQLQKQQKLPNPS